MTKAQEIALQHSQDGVVSDEWQSNRTNANTTAQRLLMSAVLELANTRGNFATGVSNAEQRTSKENGVELKPNSLKPTAELAIVAANRTHSFLQSITQEEMATSIGRLGFGAINFINGLLGKDTRSETIDCFALTVIALAANTANAPTKVDANARLIAAAPELLEALESLMCAFSGGTIGVGSTHPKAISARKAIAKATGQAA